ncbi:MAG: hypothetical protein V1694_02840 [Candidatus Eisenbacteria bacterium]
MNNTRRPGSERDRPSAFVITIGVRNRKLVEMRLVQVAKAIAEGKVKPSVSDLDKLIRLEEFLREECKAGEQTKIVIEWRDYTNPSKEQDQGTGESPTKGE